jgi:hypothetical protein
MTMNDTDTINNKHTDTAPANVPATTERMVNPFAIFRQRNSSGGVLFRGDLIKCDHSSGQWLRMHGEAGTLIGDDERFVANPLELIDTWTKFIGGKMIERKVYRTVEFEFAPERKALGDNEEHRWELDRGGRRKDPWSRAVYLPLKALSDDEVGAFKATGMGAIGEIAELCAQYASADRGGRLPVIEPDARSFESQHGSTIYVPIFRLVSWGFWEGDEPAPPVPLRPVSAVSLPAKPTAIKLSATAKDNASHDDLDEEIPF